jgi:opacity protein-like surface antigen
MSKYLKVFLLFCIFSMTMASSLHSQYKYSVSLGSNHERLHEAFGNHVRMYFNFSDNFKVYSEFARYYEVTEKNENETVGYDMREISLNMNYAVLFGDKFGIYAIIGFDYTYGRQATKVNEVVNERFKEDLGMNAGFGVFYKMGRFTPYVESRSIYNRVNYLVFTGGLAYSFGKEG